MDERYYWLGFNRISGIGIKRIEKLRAQFGTLGNAWNAPENLLKEAKLGDSIIQSLLIQRKKIDLQVEFDKLTKHHIQLITFLDEAYPSQLKTIDDPPPVLYVRGELSPQDEKALAIVGTRKCTHYGRDVSFQLSQELAQNGVTIISGLAQGIDASAHKGALKGGGRTIAVLGCGADTIYPQEHAELAKQIIGKGALISEFPLGTPPISKNFPRRNRLISGLALGVLVVEAPEKSGALITAHTAAEQGREVFVIPGNITNHNASGTNKLLQDGAKLITSTKDILNELDMEYSVQKTRVRAKTIALSSDIEAKILSYISTEPIHIDEIIRASGLSSAEVMGLLTILELKGLAQSTGYMQYSLVT
jgi:DNA processing protein